MSHYGERRKIHQGTGYWGIRNKCLPVIGFNRTIPEWLRRAENEDGLRSVAGTTLSILAFDAPKNWQKILAASIAENFFGAIQRGRLDVAIEDIYRLNQSTIGEIFDDESLQASLSETKDEPEKFINSGLFLETIRENRHVIVENTENFHLGNCELRMIVGEGLPKRVAILRDGMLITQELDGLRRFGEFKEFVATVECHSTKGNELLRGMEPPKHDDFEPDRLPTEAARRAAKIALRELAKWVREMLKRHAQDPVSEVTSIDELQEFFPDEAEQGTGDRKSEEDPAGDLIIRLRPLKRSDRRGPFGTAETPTSNGNDGGDGEEDGDGRGTGEGGDGGTRNDGEGGTAGGGGRNQDSRNTPARVHLRDVRSIPVAPRKRRIAFTPDYSGDIRLIVQDSGADTNVKLQVTTSSAGKVAQGMIGALSVSKGQRYVMEIELEKDFDGAMRVAADAV